MKKIILSAVLLLLLLGNSFGQTSISEATKNVNEFISELQIGEYLLYQNPEIVKSETELATFEKSIISIPSDSWIFFLDKNPLKGWSHPCSFLFVEIKSGKIIEKEWKLPPNNLEKWKLLTEIKEQSEIKLFNFKKSNATLLKSGITPANCYAVIISGGYDMANNWQRYWNDCSAIYSALVDVYNYEDDHIYTIMSDGTSTANDRRISGGYDSSPLDLDGDGDNDIQFSATRANITTVFNTLSGLLDSDDYLFIFVTDHGDQESGQDALIYLWGETIRDDQFATEVNKVNAGEISIVMEQCYSGGFVDDLASLNRVIATACDFDETSCGMGYYTYDEFVFDWIAAIAGEDPNGNAVDADDNNDGFVSMQEAFGYADVHNACSETPQYYSNKHTLGENLTLLGKELCVSVDYIVDMTINANQSIKDCGIVIAGVIINNNANVIFDAEKEIIILDDFETTIGTVLELK